MTRRMTALLLAAALLVTSPAAADPVALETGPDTTVFDGPLREDGTVDYLAALNAMLMHGVTNDTNAFAALWHVRPTNRGGEAVDELIAEALGLPVEAEGRPVFVHFSSFMVDSGRCETFDEAFEIEYEASRSPFVGDDMPDVMAWLERSETALDHVVLGLDRPHFHFPWIADAGNEAGILMGVYLPHLSMYRGYARALEMRINMALGEGRDDDAITDLLALRRMGAMVRRDPALISNLVGLSIDAISHKAVQHALTHAELSAAQLDRLEAGWSPDVGQLTIAQVLDLGDRLNTLDLLQQAWAGRLEDDPMRAMLLADAPHYEGAYVLVRDGRFDINRAMRMSNAVFDDALAIVNAETYSEFARQIETFELGIEKYPTDEEVLLLGRITRGADTSDLSAEEMSRLVVSCLHRVTLPSIRAARKTEYVAQMRAELGRVGLALARFKLDDGAYPDTLDELVPGHLEAVPLDLFDGEPLRYVPDNDRLGYLLYSVGRDMTDHGGSEERGQRDVPMRVGGE